jgi:Sugar (pentulose and hexulose) kinases
MKNVEKRVLAFDFGASSGRAILGIYDGKTIRLQEIHRFSNDPVTVQGTMYWDILRLFHEVKQSLSRAQAAGGIDSIGVDTWGVDFGLLDAAGRLMENPIHYRDTRTQGMLCKSFAKIDKAQFYEITGNQFMEINTAFQLLSLAEKRSEFLGRAATMLLMPDLLNYLLSGVKTTEFSIASTTQLLDAKTGSWSKKVINALGLPENLFTEIVSCGTKIGEISDELSAELGLVKAAVIAVAGHDTQSAMVAVPTVEQNFIFLSCGTWSLLGTELDRPQIDALSERYNITNEGGYQQKTSFLKNIIGLWLIQESRRQWLREGMEYSFVTLEEMAKKALPLRSLIDPDAPEFIAAGNIPERIRQFCRRSGQAVPQTAGEIVRCINESLALKYCYVLEQLEECTGRKYPAIHMVGGGTQSSLLCQFTANACDCKVMAGPVEATVLGNIVLQLIAAGSIPDLATGRRIVAESQPVIEFRPQDRSLWEEAYKKFKELILC